MVRALWDACVLLWILAHEREDPEDGGEIWPLPAAEKQRDAEGGVPYKRGEAVA